MRKFYVTYGTGSVPGDNFSVLHAESFTEAHDAAMAATGGQFAFMYEDWDFVGQPERYGLTEIPLQPQILKE